MPAASGGGLSVRFPVIAKLYRKVVRRHRDKDKGEAGGAQQREPEPKTQPPPQQAPAAGVPDEPAKVPARKPEDHGQGQGATAADGAGASTKLVGAWDVVSEEEAARLRAARQQPAEAAAAAAPAPPPGRRRGRLGPVVRNLETSVVERVPGTGEVAEVLRAPFLEGVEGYAAALDALGGNLGSYLVGNLKKIQRSKASGTCAEYCAWMLTELPVHGPGYRGYIDESAWMANLWIGWTLEFFVELFAQLHQGIETKVGVDIAYAQSLYHHHNFFQRTAFSAAVKSLPNRAHILQVMTSPGDNGEVAEDVSRDLGEFVAIGREMVKFCLRVNDQLDARLRQEREGLAKR